MPNALGRGSLKVAKGWSFPFGAPAQVGKAHRLHQSFDHLMVAGQGVGCMKRAEDRNVVPERLLSNPLAAGMSEGHHCCKGAEVLGKPACYGRDSED